MQRTRTNARPAWPYRVYAYGATLYRQSALPAWTEALRQVVFTQRDLWNACLEAWERNRTQYEALLAQADALRPLREAHSQALETVQSASAGVKQARQKTRQKRYPGWEADLAAQASARQALSVATTQLKTAEAAYRTLIRPQLTALLDALWKEIHGLGQASPLAWYNERQVTDSFRNTVERFLKRLGGPPRRKGRLTSAHVTYHFTGPPLAWEQLLGEKSSMIQLDPVDPWVWDDTQPQGPRRRAARTEGRLRLSDTATLTFGVTLQRRPPPGALVKGVDLVGRETLRPFGGRPGRWRWTLLVLCEVPPPEAPGALDTRPRAALDLNWRILSDDRVRALMVWDGTEHTPLYFPAALTRRWRFAQTLQEELAAALERCKASLSEVWQQAPLPPDVAPRGAGWSQTGQGGLLRLLTQVEALPQPVPSRDPTLRVLTSWSRRSATLWREWRGLTGRLERAKAAWYAVVAKDLCTRYSAIALEDLSLRQMAQDEEQTPRLAQSQKYRQLVGLSSFVQRLTHTAAREGVTLTRVDPAWTTRTCAVCGAHLPKQSGDLVLVCPQGHAYDQDESAAQIVWERAFTEDAVLSMS